MPGWSTAVPRTIQVLQDLRNACCQSPSRLISICDFDVALGPLRFIDEHRSGPMPTLEVFAPRSQFFDSLQRVMAVLQYLAKGHSAVWGVYFSTLSMLLQLVFARNEAAILEYGSLEHPDDGLRAYQHYVWSYDAAVADICLSQRCDRWQDVRDWGTQFVSQQLFAHVLAQCSSGLDYATFTKGMQRDSGAVYLALIYQELDAQRVIAAAPNVRAVTVLGIAEGITYPYDGVKTQATFAVHIRAQWNGHLSAGLIASLSPAQIHALRSPLRVWPAAKTFCHHCSIVFDQARPRRACKGCKRAVYCGQVCQRRDWNPVHKIVCPMWRLVAERESFRKVRAQIKKLPLDPVQNFPP